MEDLLVSNVFGCMKYVTPQDGLVKILSSSEDMSGKALSVPFGSIVEVNYKFWPWVHEEGCNGCEPDVLIDINLEKSKVLLFVEAKYFSDKSSEADEGTVPQDQLAREYDNLRRKAEQESALPIFLYVTDDICYPKESIAESDIEYAKKRNEHLQVFWVSWRTITRLFPEAKKDSILYDLTQMLIKQGLFFFEGAPKLKSVRIFWSFDVMKEWSWGLVKNEAISWKYERVIGKGKKEVAGAT